MKKYVPLRHYLERQPDDVVPMTFEEIRTRIGTDLPRSAFNHRPWWSNNPANSVITKAWLEAGFKTEQVDMKARRLVFRRTAARHTANSEPATHQVAEESPPYETVARHPLFGALKGLARVAPDTDLTQPAEPEWGGTTR